MLKAPLNQARFASELLPLDAATRSTSLLARGNCCLVRPDTLKH